MKKIQPINNNVLIKLDEVKEDKTSVVAVPPDSDIGISVGDRVIYKSFSGTEITFEGDKYLIVLADDILAKFVEVDAI